MGLNTTIQGAPSSILTRTLSSIFGHPSDPLATIDLSPTAHQAWKPFYYHPHESLIPGFSDKYMSLLLPICTYWLISGWFTFLDVAQLPFFEQFRLHEPEELTKRNKVSATRVIAMVVVQQAIQTFLGVLVLDDDETILKQVFADHQGAMRTIGVWVARAVCGTLGYEKGLRLLQAYGVETVQWMYWWIIPTAQMWLAFFIMDCWQYVLHRSFHESRFLYRHFHSHHHRLYVPYSFGALYNHPLEGLLFDSAGTALAHALALMTIRQAIFLFTFSTLKTVCDHGGYAFPWWLDPLHLVFPNCAEYHDVHHQMLGLRYNYSQPYFIHFDILFGTRVSAEKFEKIKSTTRRKAGARVGKAATASSPIADSAAITTAAAATAASTTPTTRQRSTRRDNDEPAEEVAIKEKNPLVTRDIESYRAKAGVQVAASS